MRGPIGVFDSGMGGLTVLHECLVTMPNEDFVYLGDHARLPYGPRPLPEIRRFALEIGGYLEGAGREADRRRVQRRHVGRAARAAGGARGAGRRRDRARGARRRAGDAQPAHRPARDAGDRGRPAATRRSCTRSTPASSLHAVACPRLVPLIESDDPFGAGTVEAVREYAGRSRQAGCDTVILGCTHYPLIRPVLAARLRARRDARLLGRGDRARGGRDARAQGIASTSASREGDYRFLTTGDPEQFRRLGRALPPAPARRGRARVARRARARGGMTRNDGAGPTSFARSRSSPTSSSSRTARCSSSAGQARSSSAPRRSRNASRAGCTGRGRGWMTAEYSLLPASTGERTQREAARASRRGAPSRSSA